MPLKKHVVLSILLFFLSNLYAVPLVFNYQGVFLDSAGKALPIKDSLKFALFDKTAGSIEMWSESHYVVSANGVFSVNIGSKNKLSPSLVLNNDSLYIEISKGGIKGSRIKINSVIYAIKSSLADTASFARLSDSSRFTRAAALADSSTASYRALTAIKADTSVTALLADSSKTSYRALTARVADSAIKTGPGAWSIKANTAYYNNGNVGIGTDSAKAKLNVVGNAIIENPSGDVNLSLLACANPALSFKQKGGAISDNRAEFNFSNNALYLNIWDSAGGAGVPGAVIFRQKGVVLDAKGTIKATGFMVNSIQLNVPDYVFDSSYSLKSIHELDAYVNTHHHLPGIPSAAEIKSKGMDLAEMNLRLLEKVEELTLYVIHQEKTIKALEKAVKDTSK